MRSRRFVVSGRVQGVGFRYFVVRQAESLGLDGWVRNLAGGSVEALAAGEDGAMAAFEGKLWSGPPHARVDDVLSALAEPPSWEGFRILPTAWD